MKKEYLSIELEVIIMESQDIVTASGDDFTQSDIFDD